MSIGFGRYLRLYSRLDWDSAKPTGFMRPITLPVTYFRLTDTGTDGCDGLETCTPIIKQLQEDALAAGLQDIPYNFLISEDGCVYCCRGWYKRAHMCALNEWNNHKAIEIAYIGNYANLDPPFILLSTALDLIKYGAKNRIVDPFFQMNEFKSKSS